MGFRRRELNKKLVNGIVDDDSWGRDDPESMTRSKGLRAKQKKKVDVDHRLYFLVFVATVLVVGGMAVKFFLGTSAIHRSGK